MISSSLAASLGRRDIHYGWVVAAVTFLTMLVTAGAVGAPGVFIVPLQEEFGWQTAEISSALAIRLALFGLLGPFAAAFMNRFGVRRMVLIALAIIAVGLLASLAMSRVWQLILLWGVVVGVGTGLTALVLGATVATRWFSARRGLVVGMLMASSATGQLLFLPLLASLTDRFGWRIALGFVCVMLLGAVRHLLHLRRQHQRPDPDALHRALRRLRPGGGRRGGRAGADGRLRSLRHGRLGLGLGPLRQPLAAVLVLWPPRPVPALSAVHRFLVLWSVAVRRVLRSRLAGDRTANREAHRRALRPRTHERRLRLDLRRPPARRGIGRVWRRTDPDRVRDLSAGVLCRRPPLPGRGPAGADAHQAREVGEA